MPSCTNLFLFFLSFDILQHVSDADVDRSSVRQLREGPDVAGDSSIVYWRVCLPPP